MSTGTKNARRSAVRIALAGLLGLGLAACEKKPVPPPPPPAAAPAVKPAEIPPAPPPAAQPPAPAPAQPAEQGSADKALAAKVKAALGGVKGLDAGGIDVQTSDGQVRLYGTVANAAQRDEAAKAAAAVPGVKAVENHLAVVSGS
ncbi:MAG: BON domain-containing protein [Betaproteobacteria bacterium]|nr:BON domain-containing protein [Betaproteobacteria bacterium]